MSEPRKTAKDPIMLVLKALLFYALIPFVASLPGLFLSLTGWDWVIPVSVPLLTALAYFLFRKKIDLPFACKVNAVILLVLMTVFTVMMVIASGSVEGLIMSHFSWLILPLAPVMLILRLMDEMLLLYLTAFLTYLAALLVCAVMSKVSLKRWIVPAAIVLLLCLVNTHLYLHRPAVRYSGHGFDYMHGYSSTDFSDYTVYSQDSKLVVLDHPASLQIEDPDDMPVMDGAEACYPLYAAFAKAVYKDIDRIEQDWLKATKNTYYNGRIVSFTNTLVGFKRLVVGADEWDTSDSGVDLFFGARPSAQQIAEAKESGVELEITPIGKEAFVFFVEEDNPVSDLTSDQVRAIYSGEITNWKQLGGKDQKIIAFQRPQDSGSQTMMVWFMGQTSLKEPETYEMVSAMTGVIRKVAQYSNEKGAIGYSFRYFLEELGQEQHVKMLSIDGVYPSLQSIEDGTYPLTVDLCLITRKDDPNPYVRQMIDFALSEDGQEIVRRTGYGGVGD